MAAKKTTKTTAGRGRPVLKGRKQDVEIIPLGAASAGCDPDIWAELLTEAPRLTEADRTLAEDYCATVRDIEEYRAAIKEHGLLIDNGRGGMVRNPVMSALSAAQTHLLHTLREMGATPKQRAVKKRQPPSKAGVPVADEFFAGNE